VNCDFCDDCIIIIIFKGYKHCFNYESVLNVSIVGGKPLKQDIWIRGWVDRGRLRGGFTLLLFDHILNPRSGECPCQMLMPHPIPSQPILTGITIYASFSIPSEPPPPSN
jgi:hypothetical protein